MASAETTARDLDSEYEADLTDILSVYTASDEEEIRQSILLEAAFEVDEDEDSEKAMALDNDDPDDTDNPYGNTEDRVEDGVQADAAADVEMHPVQGEAADNAEEKPKDSASGSDLARSLTLASAGRHTFFPSTA